MKLRDYLSKMRGGGKHHSSARVNNTEILWSWIGGFAGISAIFWINQILFADTDLTVLFAPFGASSVLAYGAIQSPLAQPRNIIGGHVVSAISGIICYKLLYTISPGVAAAASVATAIAAMQLTRTVHPPGGATALIAVIGSEQLHRLGWLYVLAPAALGAIILVIVAVIVNNIPSSRHYPNTWW